MKKVSLVVVTILTAFALAFALTGCGNSDEKAIRDGLNNQFKQFKDPKSNLWQKDMKDAITELEALGISSTDLINAWIEGFAAEVGTIKIDGNKATAEVKITCKQFFPAVDSATDKLLNDPNLMSMTDDEMMKKFGDLIVSELKASKPVTTTLSIPCTKSGSTWTEAAGAEDEYNKALLGQN